MSVSKKGLGVLLACLCGAVSAQSIDELSDLNRQAMLADARAKLDKKKEVGTVAPGSFGGQLGGANPPGPSNSGAAPAPSAVKQVIVRTIAKPLAPPPTLVAIYGVGGRLLTELNDGGFEGKYREGDRTPSGWTVSRIERRLVAMTRPQSKGRGFETVSLPFGVKLDEPKEKEMVSAPGTTSGFISPPLPSTFPLLLK